MSRRKAFFILLFAFPLACTHVLAPPISYTDWINVEEFEARLDTLETQMKESKSEGIVLLDTVSESILGDVEAKRQELITQVEKWNRDIDAARVEELNSSVGEGLVVAQANGLPVAKLRHIFELTKNIIRRGEFKVPDFQPPDKESFQMYDPQRSLFSKYDYEAYFNTLFSYVQSKDDAISVERAQQQEFRVRLYRRATLAFLKSLLASDESPGECSGTASLQTLIVNDREVPSTGCHDPVVKNLRDYLNAIRQIQSADADVLVAEAEMLVAQQQYAADVMAGIPVVGEFLDVYAVYAGENIAGVQLSDAERGFVAVMLALPIVGPAAGEMIQQGAKRMPGFKAAQTATHDTLSYLLERGSATTLGRMAAIGSEAATDALRASYEAYQATAKMLAKDWDVALDSLDELLVVLRTRPDKKTRFLNQALEDGAYARKVIADLPDEIRIAARLRSQEIVEGPLARLKRPRQASGVVDEHMDAMLALARRNDEIYIVRPVNPKATEWIEKGYSTKPMTVKAKSASRGPFAGLIPVDPHLNKIGSKLDEAEAALRVTTDAADRARILTDIEELKGAIKKAERTMADCQAAGCAKQVPFTLDGLEGHQTVHKVTGPSGEVRFAVLEDGKWLDADALEGGQRMDLGFAPTKNEPVLVLADENGIPYTADYDFLNYAENKPHARPGQNEATGYITDTMDERLQEINEATSVASKEARDVSTQPVSHHGPEQLNPYTPGVDYPLTVIDGHTGDVFVLPQCDATCMQGWCETTKRCDPLNICGTALVEGCVKVDPDRLLKDYYHDSRLAGYTVDPNPKWCWGEYNGLSGWTHPEVHQGGYSWPVIQFSRRGATGAGRGLMRLEQGENRESAN